MKYPPWPEGQKLVHLDLKGAPPKAEYLHKLIELFSDLGAKGLLVEYEDMFPYEGELQLLKATSQPAYSRQEILSLLKLARSKSMEVIPLVQTFGHMEFALKHQPLWGLREVPHCVGTLNPHKKEGQRLVMEMLRQVVESHPGVNYLHIGCDEVYMLGEGEDSQLWLASTGCTVEQLFLSHVTKVAKAIKEAWPHITIIMWDDMMRIMSPDTLKDSRLVGLVQPMLWDYTPDLDVDRTVSLLRKYHTAGLSGLWAASSFKGSTCVHTCVPSTQKHVDNHVQWLKVAAALPTDVHLKGIALTGWQRYDHMSVLCELMPLALPSLGACLQTLVQGQLSDQAQSRVCERLSVPSVEVEALDRRPQKESLFPGRRLAELIVDLNHLLKSDDIRFFENSMAVRGWFSPYQQQRRMVNPLITMTIHSQASAHLTMLQQRVEEVKEEMLHFYPECTAEEWIEEHVSPVMAPLQRITEDILACVKEIVP